MPSIKTKATGGVIRWDKDDWLPGLVPSFSGGSDDLLITSGLAVVEACDPFRFPGYLSPGYEPTEYTNGTVADTLQKNGVSDANLVYTIGGNKINKLNVNTDTVTSPAFHTITPHAHSSLVGEDIIIYWANVGGTLTKQAFYSWNDDTDGDIGRFDLSATFDDDFMSTVPTGGAVLDKDYPHPMIIGSDGLLYIGNGNKVDSYEGDNGNDGTYTAEHHDIPDGYIITSFAKTSSFLVIYAYRPSKSSSSFYRAETTAFFWDYKDDLHAYIYDLPGNYINAGFQFKGTIGCFTQNRTSLLNNQTSKMMLFDGSKFKTVAEFPEIIPEHGGTESTEDLLYWKSAGAIYSYGSQYKGFQEALNKIAKVEGTGSGMVKNFFANGLTVSALNGINPSIFRLEGFNDDFSVKVPQVAPPMIENSRCRVTNVKIFFKGVASTGMSITLTLVINKGQTTDTVLSSFTIVTNDTMVISRKHQTDNTSFSPFSSIGWQVTGNGNTVNTPPIIEAIEIYFEYINI